MLEHFRTTFNLLLCSPAVCRRVRDLQTTLHYLFEKNTWGRCGSCYFCRCSEEMLLFLKELKASFGEYSSCLLLSRSSRATCFPRCDITVELTELQVHSQVRALDLKWCTLLVVLWSNKCSCTVLFIGLTMCCRNRVQSQLSICTFPLVSDKGRSAEFARLSRGTTDLRRVGRFIFPGKNGVLLWSRALQIWWKMEV